MVIGHEKGSDTESRIRHNFGMAKPEGYRKAVRLMELAEQFSLPVITLIDTAGAYPGIGAEERGQAEAIARSTDCCLAHRRAADHGRHRRGRLGRRHRASPRANRILMLEHAIYTVASPEAAASILWRDCAKAIDAATNMKITAQDLDQLGVIDVIITEPIGGAHRDRESDHEGDRRCDGPGAGRVRRQKPRGNPPPAARPLHGDWPVPLRDGV